MKAIKVLLVVFSFTMYSCSDAEEVQLVGFEGTYIGDMNCTGALKETIEESYQLRILKVTDSDYKVDFGDEIIFDAVRSENTLSIAEQTIGEGFDFDVVTLSGSIKYTEESGYYINFIHEVDEEGMSTCANKLNKL